MTDHQFSNIVSQYQSLVYTVCCQLVRDHQLAEDLTQETFLAAYIHMEECPAEKLRPWLVRIASNKATDYLRSAWHRKVSVPGEEAMTLPGTAPPGPEELLVTESETEAIRQLVNHLKEPYLQVSQLYFLEEKSVDEIALTLRRPTKTVYSQVSRARKLLKEQLRERSEEA